jgi:hypothetical protein
MLMVSEYTSSYSVEFISAVCISISWFPLIAHALFLHSDDGTVTISYNFIWNSCFLLKVHLIVLYIQQHNINFQITSSFSWYINY